MIKIEVFLFILLLEIVVLFVMLISLILERIIIYFFDINRKKKINYLSTIILDLIEKGKTEHINLPHSIRKTAFIVEVLSSFELRFQGKQWEEIKAEIIEKYVFPNIRKWTKSFFWKKRLIAARGFSLHSNAKDAPAIHRFIDDKSFLIQSVACLASVRLADEKGMEKILKKMSREPSFSLAHMQDILLRESNSAFFLIEKILRETKSEEILTAGLHILAMKRMAIHVPILKKALQSSNANLRLAAISLHANNPQEDSEKILQKAISDSDLRIRKQACLGLRHFPSTENIKKLAHALDDEDCDVQLAAGQSLKKMGNDAKIFIQKKAHSKNKQDQQLASYILNIE
jgi:hypothetical protein